jgi:hypothetical protein
MAGTMFEFLEMFKGKEVFVVGKGPSLEFVSSDIFLPVSPVICLNDAIVAIERLNIPNQLFSLQKDGYVMDMVEPASNTVLILQSTPGYSGEWFPNHPKRILVDPLTDLGFEHEEATSAEMAIRFACMLGCSHIHLISCDVLANGDTRTFSPRNKEVFIDDTKVATYSHAKYRIMLQLENLSYDFVIPRSTM